MEYMYGLDLGWHLQGNTICFTRDQSHIYYLNSYRTYKPVKFDTSSFKALGLIEAYKLEVHNSALMH